MNHWRARLAEGCERLWYGPRRRAWPLLPLAWLYGLLRRAHEGLYRSRLRRPRHPGVPVIVVGNLTVGGTGKTPLVIWLADALTAAGWRPGIVTRGYGRRRGSEPRVVTVHSMAQEVGDEALLLARRTGCPVISGPDRVAAARLLVTDQGVDTVLSDDGLQHYGLARDLEWVAFDAARGTGNGWLLPAGPLRAPLATLASGAILVSTGGPAYIGGRRALPVSLRQRDAVRIRDGLRRPLAAFAGQTVHAVAGIGHAARFFDQLRDEHGLQVIAHAFTDHHAYVADDLDFGDGLAVVMTEKDAVKCEDFTGYDWWAVPVDAEPAEPARGLLLDRLGQIVTRSKAKSDPEGPT